MVGHVAVSLPVHLSCQQLNNVVRKVAFVVLVTSSGQSAKSLAAICVARAVQSTMWNWPPYRPAGHGVAPARPGTKPFGSSTNLGMLFEVSHKRISVLQRANLFFLSDSFATCSIIFRVATDSLSSPVLASASNVLTCLPRSLAFEMPKRRQRLGLTNVSLRILARYRPKLRRAALCDTVPALPAICQRSGSRCSASSASM